MKKHLTSTYFHQQFEHIFNILKSSCLQIPLFHFCKTLKRFHTSTFQPKVLINTELGKSKQTTFTMWPHHGMSGISVFLNVCPSAHNIFPSPPPQFALFLHKQIQNLSHLNHKVINLLNTTSIGQI